MATCSQLEPTISVLDAMDGRRSIRRFLPDEPAMGIVEDLLRIASRSPSGTNFQPWKVHVVRGSTKAKLSTAVLNAARNGERSPEYAYQPGVISEPYLSRRRKVGYDLYALYGIARDDRSARFEAELRNFDFFGAPIGLFVTMERSLTYGSWLDCGMFMQSVMVAARGYGLETCAQQAWCDYGAVVHRELGIGDDHFMVSGMSLGFADWSAAENSLRSERVAVEEFTTWHD